MHDNLPFQLTSFVGREAHIAQLGQLVSHNRLVSLVGPGGVGKTRLALEVARRHLDQHADGVWLIELGAVLDERHVARTLAATLNIRESDDLPLVDTVADLQAAEAPRYQLPETLRQYASARLRERGEELQLEQRHSEYYLGLRQLLEVDVHDNVRLGPRLPWLGQENENLRAAFRWCLDHRRARLQRGVRLIVLDRLERVLLFGNDDPVPLNPEEPDIRSHWLTPGGPVEPGETLQQAAVRKLQEEAGIVGASIGPCVWRSQLAIFYAGVPTLIDAQYVLVHVDEVDVDTSLESARNRQLREYRWWTLPELHATEERLYPQAFAELVEPLVRGRLPPSPIRVVEGLTALAFTPAGVGRSRSPAG